jgi:hypothetical protein
MKRREFDVSSSTTAGRGYGEDLMTERGYYRFTVKEGTRSHFWIAAEPAGDTIKSLDDCVLGFDLEPGASHGHAVAVADFLNRTSWRLR